MRRGSRKSDTDRLAEALNLLPGEIAFLRDAILEIAAQDQDLLGCGEADTSAPEDALRQHAGTGAIRDKATEAADALQAWLKKLPDHDATWAGPIWFVEAFLRGMDLFDVEELPAKRPPKPVLGLRHTEVDVPAGMKTKLYAGGLEMKNREVQIIVMELDEGSYETRWRTPPRPVPADWPYQPRRFAEEHITDLPLGKVRGERKISRDTDTGLIVMSSYLLIFPAIKVEVAMFAKKRTGADLTKYETVIASIRAK